MPRTAFSISPPLARRPISSASPPERRVSSCPPPAFSTTWTAGGSSPSGGSPQTGEAARPPSRPPAPSGGRDPHLRHSLLKLIEGGVVAGHHSVSDVLVHHRERLEHGP